MTRYSLLIPLLLLPACKSDISSRTIPPAIPPFEVLSISPADGALDVDRKVTVVIQLSLTVDRAALPGPLEDLVIVEKVDQDLVVLERVSGIYALEDSDTRIVFTPEAPFEIPAARYRITILPGIRDVEEQELDLEESPVPIPSIFTTANIIDSTPPIFAGIGGLEVLSSSALRVTWDPAVDDVADFDEIFYRVYRNDPPGRLQVDYTTPALETAPGILDVLLTGLSQGTDYTVGVRAVDFFGNESANTETLEAQTIPIPDTTPPTFAGIAGLEPLSPTTLRASWIAASDDRDAARNIRYRVFLVTVPGQIDFQAPLLTTSPGVTEQVLERLDPDRAYSVAVRALDTSDNEETNSQTLQARTLASFSQNVFPIISSPALGNCSQRFCHDSTFGAGGLSMGTVQQSFANLVNVQPSNRTAREKGLFRVAPGNIAGSFLIRKLDGNLDRGEGDTMPSGAPLLDPSIVDVIRRWIQQDAPNN